VIPVLHVRVSLVMLGLLFLPACEDRKPAPPEQRARAGPAAAAVVDGEMILRSEVEEQVARRTRGRNLTRRDRRRLLRAALDERVEAVLVDAALRKAGIRVPVEEIDLRLEARREDLGGTRGLGRFLEGTGHTEEDLRADLRREAGLARLLARLEPLRLDDEAVEKMYRLEYGDVGPPLEVRFSMILMRLPPDAGPGDEERVRRDIMRVLQRIEASMTFEEAAHEYSHDPSREFGGQREHIELRRLEPRLRAALEAAPVGKVTGPVRTAEGWVLLRPDGRRAEMDTAAAARKAGIRARLLDARIEERRGKYLKRLREEATVEISEDLR